MEIKLGNKTFHVTDMIMCNTDIIKYNVFDENYNHFVTIDAKNEIDFGAKFNQHLININYELE